MIRIALRWTIGPSALALALAGCAGPGQPLSPDITRAPPGNVQLVEAVSNPDANLGRPVRWGGEVVEVNRAADGHFEVVVLERRLGEDGQPMFKGPTDGRFLIRATPQVDRDLYRVGTDITVAGRFSGLVSPADTAASGLRPLVTVSAVHNWGYGGYPDPYYSGPYYRYPPYHGPRVHFGFGLSRGLHRGHRHGYPYW